MAPNQNDYNIHGGRRQSDDFTTTNATLLEKHDKPEVIPKHEEPASDCSISLKRTSVCNRLSFVACKEFITSAISDFFYHYGKFVASHPLIIIGSCFLITGLSAFGLIGMRTENRPFHLWVPEGNVFTKIQEWKEANFPESVNVHRGIYKADNILSKDVLLDMLYVHEVVSKSSTIVSDEIPNDNITETPRLVTWQKKCIRIPVAPNLSFKRRKRDLKPLKRQHWSQSSSTNNSSDEKSGGIVDKMSKLNRRTKRAYELQWYSYLPRESYCDLIDHVRTECLARSILDIWSYDRRVIEALTQDQIIRDINSVSVSNLFQYPINYTELMGGVERNDSGHIVKVKSTFHFWFTAIDFEKIIPGKFVNLYTTGLEIDVDNFRLEEQVTEKLKNLGHLESGAEFNFMLSQSFNIVDEESVFHDSLLTPFNYAIVFIYVLVMLGKCSAVESRPGLSIMGILSVLMSVCISYGICVSLGFMNSIVNQILPFLLLALGIDDMFVIIEALNNLSESERKKDLSNRIGTAMKHAGASISITSMTNMTAFAVGALTAIPALRSFCIYTSVGIVAVFIFQSSFYVACLTLDQQRIENNKNSILCCWKMKNYQPKMCSGQKIFSIDTFCSIILNPLAKKVILVTSYTFFIVSCWGLSNLEQKFDIYWFIPEHSYPKGFLEKRAEYFPTKGEHASIFISNVSLHSELPQIRTLINNLRSSQHIYSVNDWYTDFETYFEIQGFNASDHLYTEEEFQYDLSSFLSSTMGMIYRLNFVFETPFVCNASAPRVISTKIDYVYNQFQKTDEKLSAYDSITEIARDSNITGYVRTYSNFHGCWETDRIIASELYTNLGLAFVVVFLLTLFLLVSFIQSIFVLSCVLMTLVEVGALMHWWGLTIDAASCIDLVIAVGLCVDYAAHIAHMFMTCRGNRDDRVRETLKRIGPAVFNGGVSTLLAFTFLIFAKTHIFITFFKVFLGVVIFGMYQGLVYLPVLLSFIGPEPYKSSSTASLYSITEGKSDDICGQNLTEVIGRGMTDIGSESSEHFKDDDSATSSHGTLDGSEEFEEFKSCTDESINSNDRHSDIGSDSGAASDFDSEHDRPSPIPDDAFEGNESPPV